MLGKELVDDFRQQLVSHERGVVVIRDYDTGDTFGAAVGVECVICSWSTSTMSRKTECPTLFLNILPLSGSSPLGDCLAEERHEFPIAITIILVLALPLWPGLWTVLAACESRVCAQVLLSA